jgi:hypothetical protein
VVKRGERAKEKEEDCYAEGKQEEWSEMAWVDGCGCVYMCWMMGGGGRSGGLEARRDRSDPIQMSSGGWVVSGRVAKVVENGGR